jgi:hypothetical protein
LIDVNLLLCFNVEAEVADWRTEANGRKAEVVPEPE